VLLGRGAPLNEKEKKMNGEGGKKINRWASFGGKVQKGKGVGRRDSR